MPTAMVDKKTDQLCTFRLGNLYLGIDVLDVREVLQTAEITAVPHAHAAVEGLINLRGQIATAINLRKRLGVRAVELELMVDPESKDQQQRNENREPPIDFEDLGSNGDGLGSLSGHDLEAAEQTTESESHSEELKDRSGLPLHVVIMSDEEPVTLMVDAIGDVVDVDRSAYEVPPPTLTGAARRFIRGAYKMDGELLLLLDLPRLVSLETAAEALED